MIVSRCLLISTGRLLADSLVAQLEFDEPAE
jgi:hypothetical protein